MKFKLHCKKNKNLNNRKKFPIPFFIKNLKLINSNLREGEKNLKTKKRQRV